MRSLDENSKTKIKSLMYRTDDHSYLTAAVRTGDVVEFSIGSDEMPEISVELNREEARELANFILRGL